MKKCRECGGAMTKEVRDHHYVESGLDDVILAGIPVYRCASCGHEVLQIPAITKLHQAIADAIAAKPYRLSPAEVRFVRGHLGLTNKAFAEMMGVTPEQSSRWMSSEPIGMPAERLLRFLATLGPDAFDDEKGIPAVALPRMAEVLRGLPSIEARQQPVPIRLSAGRDAWSQVKPR